MRSRSEEMSRSENSRNKERTRKKETREKEERNKKERLKGRLVLDKHELNDEEKCGMPCPRKDCLHELHFKGCLVKLFPVEKSGTINWDSRWDLKWKDVRKADGSLRWKKDCNPLKNVQKALKRHWKTRHPVSKLPFCALNSKERVTYTHSVEEDDKSSSCSSESDSFTSDSE